MKNIYDLKSFALKAITLLTLILGSFNASAQIYTVGTNSAGVNQYYEYPSPYGKWYTMGKQQFMYTYSELNSAGLFTVIKPPPPPPPGA